MRGEDNLVGGEIKEKITLTGWVVTPSRLNNVESTCFLGRGAGTFQSHFESNSEKTAPLRNRPNGMGQVSDASYIGTMRWRHSLIIATLLLLASVWFGLGAQWGLPSRWTDRWLFGDRPVWCGHKIFAVGGGWVVDANRGADVALNPLLVDETVWVNETDQQKAQIIRRWRLYTSQPDEAITLRALSMMHPSEGKFDPKLYQYGGLWIYPIGGLLGIGAKLHWITLVRDVAFYMDHPEAIARFYRVARFYSMAWGLVGVIVVYGLVWRLTRGTPGLNDTLRMWLGAAGGGLCFTMPVVITMAHEAKPHLPGAVLVLAAMWAAMAFVDHGSWRRAVVVGVLCGAALGMVLSGWVAFSVLPVLLWMRPTLWRRILAAGIVGVFFYAITNPYVLINAVTNRALLTSNLGTSVGMYSAADSPVASARTAILCIGEGASPGTAVVGVLSAITLLAGIRQRSDWLLMAAPALVSAVQFFYLADHKPMEYARFALVLDVSLAIAAVVALGRARGVRWLRGLTLMLLCLVEVMFGAVYLWAFVQDTHAGTRQLAAQLLLDDRARATALGTWAEPAPYCMPPVDIFHWKILRLGRGVSAADAAGLADDIVFAEGLRQDNPLNAGPQLRGVKIPLFARSRAMMSWANPALWVWRKTLVIKTAE